ncbi:MAG: hypothetical protein KGI51_06475 [Rhodospirillales bacterium]|nr:hypothetical protein [Rhodospirillales bacterium]
MSASEDPPLQLVPGRECGPCTVCCVALTIEEPTLRKVQGYRCPHLLKQGGCGIYETRPPTCSAYFCGWRRLKWVREGLRPDLSGVLVQLRGVESGKDGRRQMGVSFTFRNRAALKAEGLAESIAAAINAEVPVFVIVPGPPGFTAAIARVNAELLDSVRAHDKKGLLRRLTEVYGQGVRGERRRIIAAGDGKIGPEPTPPSGSPGGE